MKKTILCACLLGLALNTNAGKPEWAGNPGGKQGNKAEMKAEKKAESRSKKQKGKDEQNIVSDSDSILDDIFSDNERSVIEDYYNDQAVSGTGKYKGKKKELPQGLRKKLERGGELPPGWQKKVERGEVLDSDLRRQAEYLPEDLLDRLPRTDAATEIIKLKDKIIRVGRGQGTVIDVIDIADILTGRSHLSE